MAKIKAYLFRKNLHSLTINCCSTLEGYAIYCVQHVFNLNPVLCPNCARNIAPRSGSVYVAKNVAFILL